MRRPTFSLAIICLLLTLLAAPGSAAPGLSGGFSGGLSGFFELFAQNDEEDKPAAAAPANDDDAAPADPDAPKPADADADADAGDAPAADAAEPGDPVAPAKPKEVAQLRIIVVGLKGLVRVRLAEGQPWIKPTVGMAIGQGAQFRTGPRSAVVIRVGKDQTITLDRLGTIQVLRAIQEKVGDAPKDTTNKTDVGMPYGRTRYRIEPSGTQHESTIRAPSTTLAVRGSDVTYQDDALGAAAIGEGRLTLVIKDVQRTARAFGQGRRVKIAADRRGAADTAVQDATTDPRGPFVARTELEETSTEQMPAVGGEDLRELQDLRRKELAFNAGVAIPGNVGTTVAFTGTPGFTDVDLSIVSPPGFAVSLDNPLSSNGRVSLTADPTDGLVGATGFGSETIAIDLTGLPATAITFSLDLRSADVGPVVVPVFNIIESVLGQTPRLINDLAEPTIPQAGIILQPGVQTNFTTTVTIPSPTP